MVFGYYSIDGGQFVWYHVFHDWVMMMAYVTIQIDVFRGVLREPACRYFGKNKKRRNKKVSVPLSQKKKVRLSPCFEVY